MLDVSLSVPSRPARRPARIAILGGGFSGAALAVHLARTGGASVTLVEPDAVGRGVAYAADPAHLLNVPAARMSLYPDVPDDFLVWARARGVAASPTTFLPRALYGAYVSETFGRVAAGTTRVVRARAETVDAGPAGWRIRLADGGTVEADAVVLATGNPPPADPPGLAGIIGSPRYVADPWRRDALAAIGAADAILLVGTGLTALDVLVSLRERGHHGPIRALSRRGLVPLPHLEAGGPPAAAPVTIAPGTSLEGLVRLVHAAGKAAVADGRAWQGVVDGLRAATPTLWAGFTAVERRRFLRHLRPYWEVHRHRAPDVVLGHVRALQAAGALEIVAGRILESAASADGVAVTLRRRGSADLEQVRVAHVINTTGPDTDLARGGGALLRDLLSRGVVLQDADRLGLRTSTDAAALRADGTVHTGLYVLGQARRADLWEHTAVPDLSRGAAALAEHLSALTVAVATP
ncbi:MAG: FAD/NAD(P)-binding protein [Pseudomonadota bacterium]|nr:FAD/NAD(P)-binding protein [Pseudomonadota bacterium]